MTRRKPRVREGEVVVVMVGASHDAKDGDLRSVPAEVARSLVDRSLARYADDGESGQ